MILDTGYWISDTWIQGYWLQDTGYWIMDTEYRIHGYGYTDTRIPGYRILVTDTGNWIQDTRYRI